LIGFSAYIYAIYSQMSTTRGSIMKSLLLYCVIVGSDQFAIIMLIGVRVLYAIIRSKLLNWCFAKTILVWVRFYKSITMKCWRWHSYSVCILCTCLYLLSRWTAVRGSTINANARIRIFILLNSKRNIIL